MNNRQTTVLVNGKAVDTVNSADRGLLYGDGLFETIAIHDGRPVRWQRHMERLLTGCARLGLTPVDTQLLATEASQLSAGARHAVLKIIITRGTGGHGYRPPDPAICTRILQLHPWPGYPQAYARDGIAVRICTLRMGQNPQLAGIKHLNRLEQVLARMEWNDDHIVEGLLLDQSGCLVEGTRSNIFLVTDSTLVTPELAKCGVAGVVRGRVLELAAAAGIRTSIRQVPLSGLDTAQEVFVTNSIIGIWPVTRIGGRQLAVGGLTRQLQTRLAADPGE